MQKKYTLVLLFCLSALAFKVKAQTDNIELSDKQNILLNRLDIKFRGDSALQWTTMKPYSRKRVTEAVENIYTSGQINDPGLSAVDKYNIESLLMNNRDWTQNYQNQFEAKHPIFNTFFTNPAHLYEQNSGDYSIVVDPLLNFQFGHSSDGTNTYVNSRGIRVRGQVDNRVGYYLFLTDNQERDPLYVRQYQRSRDALPGIGYYKYYKTDSYDYFDVRGGVTFHGGKYLDFQIGYDKFFIGDGYRSLFLSDFSAPAYFLKFQIHAGHVQYTAVGAQTIAPFWYTNMSDSLHPRNSDSTRPRNFMMFHYLNWQATNWLKIGFFESTMFNSKINGGLQVTYLNPAILNKAMSQETGNSAKSSIGLDFKANFAKHFVAYGQWLVNEFHADKIFKFGDGDWVNKFGFQLGGKYIDAFTVKNLDLQLEGNLVRPFTYTDKWSQNNFTNYNQPLADPLGANFKELDAIATYQPLPKLYINVKAILFNKGLDTTAEFAHAVTSPNHGGDIFRNYNDNRLAQDGYTYANGILNKVGLASVTASWELIQNLFIDANFTYRRSSIATMPTTSAKMFMIGLRWNMARREFMF